MKKGWTNQICPIHGEMSGNTHGIEIGNKNFCKQCIIELFEKNNVQILTDIRKEKK